MRGWLVAVLWLFGLLQGSLEGAVYLTWTDDPSTTMTVRWNTSKRFGETLLHYRKEGAAAWKMGTGSSELIHTTTTLVHTAELAGLEPDTIYQFRIGSEEKVRRFRTLPDTLDKRPLTFVVGGDAYYYGAPFRQMSQQMAARSPDFVVLGGDIAYVEQMGRLFGKIKRWQAFLDLWEAQMVTPDERMIPLLVAVGNHDVGKFPSKAKDPRFFFECFAMPQQGIAYRTVDIGRYLTLFLLDTGHIAPIRGEQAEWLSRNVQDRLDVPYKFAIYHLAAYPSYYPYEGKGPRDIREAWVPSFEAGHLQAAFENHNHTFKRSHPLLGGKIDPKGVLYLGDGSWGVKARTPKPSWYLARAEQLNSVFHVVLSNTECQIKAMDPYGVVFDEVSVNPNKQVLGELEP